MSASQFVLEHIISVIGGAGVVVTSLSAYLGKLLADRSLMREKAVIGKELQSQKDKHSLEIKLIEKELQLEITKKDQFHQISKNTFEKIFESRIQIYTDLLHLKIEFFKFIDESHVLEVGEEDPTNEFYSLFMRCRESLESNKLYISDGLSKKYDLWYIKASPFLKKANVQGYHAHGMAYTESENSQNIWDAEAPVLADMIHETMDEMKNIFHQMDVDISSIRENIDAPMSKLNT